MVLAHGRLKVGGGQIFGMGLVGAPLHEAAVAEAGHQTGHEQGRCGTNAAVIVVVRDVQTLVQAVFDATKAGPIEFQPFLGVQPVWSGAGQECDVLILSALSLA